MLTAEAGQRERYLDAIDALAGHVMDEAERRGVSQDDFLDEALAELGRLEKEASSEHAWIFRDPAVLRISDHLFEALDERSDGRRDWFHADLASAVASVARYDVMSEVVERLNEGSVDEEADVAELGKA
jgi:hypothetical protein